MTTWFTADHHFGHARLLELSQLRSAAFSSIEEMNEGLVRNWNAVVDPEDTVWVLGDFDMHGKPENLARVSRLAGTKILVAGNHDACWGGVRDSWRARQSYLDAGFAAVMDFAAATLPPVSPEAQPTRILLSHFPYEGDSHKLSRYAQYRLLDDGMPLLHGHVHESFREHCTSKGTWTINVGVDWWDYAPVCAETLAHHLHDLKTAGAVAQSA